MRFLAGLLILFSVSILSAQVDLSPGFDRLLDAANLEFVEPLEARYKDVRVVDNAWQPYDFAIRSRREKLEIRFLIKPYRRDDPLAEAPQLQAIRLLTHLATNDQSFVMRGMEVAERDLREHFNADWGKVFFFTPKPGFTSWKHCKLLALHSEGQGTAFVFFLFNTPGPALDHRFYALNFRDDPVEN